MWPHEFESYTRNCENIQTGTLCNTVLILKNFILRSFLLDYPMLRWNLLVNLLVVTIDFVAFGFGFHMFHVAGLRSSILSLASYISSGRCWLFRLIQDWSSFVEHDKFEQLNACVRLYLSSFINSGAKVRRCWPGGTRSLHWVLLRSTA